jgi:hypothetical protein
MNILFDIGHPAHVHLFRNAITELQKRGHKVIVTVKQIESAEALLRLYGIEYISIGKKYDSVIFKGLAQLRYNLEVYRIARKAKIDLAVGSSITIAHVSTLHKMKAIILDDDDPDAVILFARFAHPFADCILSPDALKKHRTREKDITYKGSHELFYLHPRYFRPDESIMDEAGLKKGEVFFILRFVSGKAYHDVGEKGITREQKVKLIELLEPYGKVLLTTERDPEPELSQYQLKLSPDRIHHLMYYARLFIGDSQTMTSEAAILGTPAVKCNSFAHRLSLPNMLEDDYGLCYSFHPSEFELFIAKIEELLATPSLKEAWAVRRDRFLKETIDPTALLVWFIENYPLSRSMLKKDPDNQFKFDMKQVNR